MKNLVNKNMKKSVKNKKKNKSILFFFQQSSALISKYLKITLREKENWFWIFGYPLLFMILFSVAFNNTNSRSTYTIAIINHDIEGLDDPLHDLGGNASLYLIELFEENTSLSETFHYQKTYQNGTELTESGALELVNSEKIDGVIIIPKNFSESIIGSTWWYPLIKNGMIPPNIDDHFAQFAIAVNNTNYTAGEPQLQVHTVADTVTGVVITNIFESIVNNIVLLYNNITTLKIEQTIGPDDRNLTWFDMSAPGIIAVAVLVGISSVGTMFAFERSTGMLKRLDTTPVSRSTILLSGGSAQLIFSAIQISILLACLPLFGVNTSPGANWFLAFLIIMDLSLTCIGLGLILASFAKSTNAAGGLAWIIILPLQFLGGAFFPMDGIIQKFVPTYYAIRAIRLVLIYGARWSHIWEDLLIVFAFGVISTILGIIIFSKKKQI
ncbi:ABC transporter permease [Candidatus Harpocratesius sp.]